MEGGRGKNYLGPVLPSPDYTIATFLDMAQITAEDVIYDLGCYDGRLLIAAAQKCGALGVGVEQALEGVTKATTAVHKVGLTDKVTIIHGDAFDLCLNDATVVYLYLKPEGLEALVPKLNEELRPGTRVVSYMFRIPDWDQYLVEVRSSTSDKPGRLDVSSVSKLYLYHPPGNEASKKCWVPYAVGTLIAAVFVALATRLICCHRTKRLKRT